LGIVNGVKVWYTLHRRQQTSLHRFLATLPAVLRAEGCPPYQLIVTTNYDDVLERAQVAGEPFDLVWYAAEGEQRGKFWHLPPDGEASNGARPMEQRRSRV